MSVKPKPGHWYERKNGMIVKYERASNVSCLFPHIVGGASYTKDGLFYGDHDPSRMDLIKDLGTTEPRGIKKPVKETRAVRIWIVEATMSGRPWRYYSNTRNGARSTRRFLISRNGDISDKLICGPVFSQIINVPIYPKPKKDKS